jgi:predicted GIY-YIG superfamily endonuclease
LRLDDKQTKLVLKYTKNRNVRKLLKNGKHLELATQLGEYEKALKNLSGNKKLLLENMLKN